MLSFLVVGLTALGHRDIRWGGMDRGLDLINIYMLIDSFQSRSLRLGVVQDCFIDGYKPLMNCG